MTTDYDLPPFHFLVEWNGNSCFFPEIKGLGHAGKYADANHQTETLPGEELLESSKIVLLKHGILTAGTEFERWIQRSRLDAVSDQEYDLKISLVNEIGEVLLHWHLKNVLPVSVEQDVIDTSENIAIKEARLSYETINYLPLR